jgi:hypothetical protein
MVWVGSPPLTQLWGIPQAFVNKQKKTPAFAGAPLPDACVSESSLGSPQRLPDFSSSWLTLASTQQGTSLVASI